MPPSRTSGRRAAILAACAVAMLAVAAPQAGAAKGPWVIRGAGFGHGIGMSQYGAFGSAKNGLTHDAILRQYYSGTTLGQTQSKIVRVLLSPYRPSVSFSGA